MSNVRQIDKIIINYDILWLKEKKRKTEVVLTYIITKPVMLSIIMTVNNHKYDNCVWKHSNDIESE